MTTTPTDDEVRALVEHTEYLADFYANHGAYHSDKEVAEGFRSAATMLSRLLAERAEVRKANMSDEITTLREQLATVLRREADTMAPTDDEVRALVEQLRQPWDGTADCRGRRTQAMHIAATMLSRLLAERAEARKTPPEITTLREQLAMVTRERDEAHDAMRHVAERAEARKAQPVAIRPLEWVVGTWHGTVVFKAKSLCGEYLVAPKAYGSGWLWRIDPESEFYFSVSDEDEGKAAAQADYEALIRSALVTPPTDPQKVRDEALDTALHIAAFWGANEGVIGAIRALKSSPADTTGGE